MNRSMNLKILILLISFVFISGCGKTHLRDVQPQNDIIIKESLEDVHRIAKIALLYFGFKITTPEPLHLVGKRPSYGNLFVGACGGETTTINLKKIKDDVNVSVSTKRRFITVYFGESRIWDNDIINLIKNIVKKMNNSENKTVFLEILERDVCNFLNKKE